MTVGQFSVLSLLISSQDLEVRSTLCTLRYIFAASPLIVYVYLHSNFRGGLRKRTYLETECAKWPFKVIEGR